MSEQHSFALHARLKADTFEVIHLPLCRVLLMNDCSFPWLVLVPERMGVTEIHELNGIDRSALIEEISRASEAVKKVYSPDKINIGMLGNIVSQLHIHVIGRYRNDRAWPGPVWGTGPAQPYLAEEAASACERLGRTLALTA
jgi:diadenosine tetraphosphate (Ap4A) HIT family hydrolase